MAFAVATTTGTAAAAHGVGAATLGVMPVANAAPTYVATMAASYATLVAMTAPSETETVVMSGGAVSNEALSYSGIANAVQTQALSENELEAMAAASETALASDILLSTYCLNEEDFVASLLSGDRTGFASSAGSLGGYYSGCSG